jgi:ribosomal protein L12E/L44/L45/RPP1/RPP2
MLCEKCGQDPCICAPAQVGKVSKQEELKGLLKEINGKLIDEALEKANVAQEQRIKADERAARTHSAVQESAHAEAHDH